jgi:hypothetical protein
LNIESKEENINYCFTTSNSVSPNNNHLLSNKILNNENFSTAYSPYSNVVLTSNICHTADNEILNSNNNNKEELSIVNYYNTNPNENDKINFMNHNKNFNFTKIKENETDKFSLKNNSLNKIL